MINKGGPSTVYLQNQMPKAGIFRRVPKQPIGVWWHAPLRGLVVCPNWESGGMSQLGVWWHARLESHLLHSESTFKENAHYLLYCAFIVFIKDICKAPKLQSICNLLNMLKLS